RSLGPLLQPYLVTQGFVQKLVDHPVVNSQQVPLVAAGLNLDVQRTRELWDTVYKAPEALIKEGDWIDRPSFGIPYTYAFTGAILKEALLAKGDTKDADIIM